MADTKETSYSKESDDSAERSRVHKEFNGRYRLAKKHWADWRKENRDLYDFIAGRQWDPVDEDQLNQEGRPVVTFNVAGKYIDAVTGLQINNRQEIRYFPRTNGAAKKNELMTGAVEWCRDVSNMVDEETDAFYDLALTGMGWMECYLDKDLDPEGVAAGKRVDNMEMLPDPVARQRNLEDAKFVIRERMVDHAEYEEIFGEYADQSEDDANPTEELDDSMIDEDTGISVIPSPHDYGDSSGNNGERQVSGKCPIQDYQFWVKETRYVVTHPEMGQSELTVEELKEAKPALDQALAAGQPIKVKKVRKKIYYRGWFSKGRMGPYGLSPYQGGFTYHAITGKRDRNKQCFYGLGRAMTDSQKWTNKFFSTILYSLMVNAKGGIMAEENAFKDSRKAESEWANPNSITWLKGGAISGDRPKIMPKPQSPYPEGMDRLMQFTMNAMPETVGLNAELLGLADREQSGVLETQRKQSAMAVVAWAFDAMRRYYRSIGRQMADYVVKYMPEGMIVKITGGDSAQYIPLMKQDIENISFDVIVDEAPTSTNMRERVWAVLEKMVPEMIAAGLPIPKEVLDYTPIPTDLAEAWKKTMEPSPEQQKQKQAEIEGLMLDNAVKKATAEKNAAAAEKDRADARQILTEINAPEANGTSEAMVKAQADVSIAKMKAAVDAQIEQLKADRKAQTEILIAKLKLDTQKEIETLKGVIDLKIGKMNAEAGIVQNTQNNASQERQAQLGNASKEKIAKSKPKPATKK